ncbi:hypothetical protein [Streptomyces vilmorinianum]|uniref:hypothetical protein n=1 Tax=Streptomyces vilmorinianum TaxID=3051092 RepID=UPI0010FB2273|nr:hypothetical protein [Streptomyces vilmorinianum]
MAIIVVIEMPGVTKEQYEESWRKIHSAPWWQADGFISHAGAPGDNGWLVVDLWESGEAFEKFVEKATPIFEEAGFPRSVQPKIYEAVHVDTR